MWTSPADVIDALGVPNVDPADPYLATVCAAADAWAKRKRAEAGYLDPADGTVPSADVGLGTTLYAVGLFRERGTVDSFASFEDVASFGTTGTMGQIRRLLGIGRAQVDVRPDDAAVVAWRRARHPAAWIR